MDNLEMRASLHAMLHEVETEYAIYSNLSKVDKHNLPGDYRTFIGSNFDKAIYRQLLTALAGTSSNFESNPKKTCLLLSIGICQSMNLQQQANLEQTSQAAPLTDEARALLHLVETSIASYSDAELFTATQADAELLKARSLVERALRTIPLLKVIRFKVGNSYEQALQDTAIVQLKLDAEINQDNERNREVLDRLRGLKVQIEQALAGTAPAVFMKRLTYPNAVAECTCGNCGAVSDAKGILRARVVPGDYSVAYRELFSRISNSGSGQSQYSSVVHNAGIILPITCPSCGMLNIPSESFLTAFKLCILGRWIQSPPSPKNRDVMLTYSASVIVEGISSLFQNNQDLAQRVLQSYKPAITAEKVEVQIPELSLEDLVSSECYTAYFSTLQVHNSYKFLQNYEQRQQILLQFMLSLLHINTVDPSPRVVVESILDYPRFQQFSEELETLSERYLAIRKKYLRADILLKVVTSPDFMRPVRGYLDQILNLNQLQKLIKGLESPDIMTLFANDADTDELQRALSREQQKLSEEITNLTQRITEIADDLSHKVLAYERELFNEQSSGGWENFSLKPLASVDDDELYLCAKQDTKKREHTFSSITCNIIWRALKPSYLPIMYQTVIHFSGVLRNNPLIFNGLFAGKIQNWHKSVTRCCSLLGVDIAISNPTDYPSLFGELLYACMNTHTASRLFDALGVSETRLLRSYAVPLPTDEQLDNVIIYNTLDEVNYPVGLSVFAGGADIDDYDAAIQKYYSEELESSISGTESMALAECAAYFYCTFAPVEANKAQLQKQLGG